MYDVIESIINHTWNTNSYNSTEQQIIYYTCACVIIILTVVFIDLIKELFRRIWR